MLELVFARFRLALALTPIAIAFLQGAVHASPAASELGREEIRIISVGGAACTLSRDGEIAAKLLLPVQPGRVYSTGLASIALGAHGDLVVTCSRNGYWMEAKVAKFHPYAWTSDAPPCIPGHDVPASEYEEFCDGYRSSAAFAMPEYPRIIRVYMKRKD